MKNHLRSVRNEIQPVTESRTDIILHEIIEFCCKWISPINGPNSRPELLLERECSPVGCVLPAVVDVTETHPVQSPTPRTETPNTL